MKEQSKKIIEEMNNLAVKSLPPDLFEKWEEIKAHYDSRPITSTGDGQPENNWPLHGPGDKCFRCSHHDAGCRCDPDGMCPTGFNYNMDVAINENDSNIVSEMLAVRPHLQAEYFRRNSHRLIDDSNYWNILGTLWKLGGMVLQQDLWFELFRSDRPRRHKIMKSSERRAWRKLPKVVTAYRAANNPSEAKTAIAWTLDIKVARKFSEDGKRAIVTRQFKRSEIFAYFDRQGESEIIVNI